MIVRLIESSVDDTIHHELREFIYDHYFNSGSDLTPREEVILGNDIEELTETIKRIQLWIDKDNRGFNKINEDETITEDTYSNVLKRIEAALIKAGKDARINKDRKCVDVFDDEGNIIEQHYPEEIAPKDAKRGKYTYVGPGNGSYDLTYVDYQKRSFSSKNHDIKYISHVGKSRITRTKKGSTI